MGVVLMELVIDDARKFKQCVDAVVNLVGEGVFEVSKEGLKLRTMDPSQIAMVDFTLPHSAFSKFSVAEKVNIGLNLADLSKILARSRSGEKLALSLDEKESRLMLKFSSGQSKRSFKMPLLESGAAFPREPKISFDATVRVNGGEFKEMLRDAGLLSSHVTLHARDSEFIVEAHGDSGDLLIETKADSEAVKEVKVTAKSVAVFPYDYLDNLTRACPDDGDILIELKSDAPVRVSYEVGKAKLSYFLAPRVETA
ncbi:proliferating cell nuclear antigen (pcna) [Candidatus Micrarchaeota archaeon CG_4_10_14_0_2_um_filter_60_11]|nr:MAG: proliferating cell nuclear antigen (pcna) [Candidatus Micrarchaeota archaeon CG_4_10_14_0_2_um_filter_60_11]